MTNLTHSPDASATTELDPVTEFVMDELANLQPVEVAKRAAELIELCTRSLATKLAQQRSLAILAMHNDGLSDAEVAEQIEGMSPQKVTKLLSRARQDVRAGVKPVDYR